MRTVFQSYALFPHMTVAENIAFPAEDGEDVRRARSAERVDEALAACTRRHRQRASARAVGRAEAARGAGARAGQPPLLLLLDEPLAALDAKLREEMQIELINLQNEVGITFVFVTHDQTEALALSHRIAVMNHGRIEQSDEPRGSTAPATRFVADFIGNCNLLEGKVVARRPAGRGSVAVATGLDASAQRGRRG